MHSASPRSGDRCSRFLTCALRLNHSPPARAIPSSVYRGLSEVGRELLIVRVEVEAAAAESLRSNHACRAPVRILAPIARRMRAPETHTPAETRPARATDRPPRRRAPRRRQSPLGLRPVSSSNCRPSSTTAPVVCIKSRPPNTRSTRATFPALTSSTVASPPNRATSTATTSGRPAPNSRP